MLLRDYRQQVLCALLLMAFCSSAVTIYGVYMPSYLSTVVGLPRGEVAWHTAVAYLLVAPLSLLAGLLTDFFNRKMLVAVLAVLIAVGSFPAFVYFSTTGAELKNMVLVSGAFAAISSGLLPPMVTGLFPTEVRYSGIALTYNLGFAVFGGIAPFLSTWLVEFLGSSGPAWLIALMASSSLLSLLFKWPDYSSEGL